MNDYTSNLWKFYIASILSGFAVFYNGVDTLFFRHFDLSFEQIGFLISAHLIAVLLFEIPTGSFADIYGKKLSILTGSFFSLVGLGFLAFGSGFVAFAIGFILLGIGRSFRSGAESALHYDWLSVADKKDEYIKHQSSLQEAFVGIDIISGSGGFLLFSLNVRIPFIISFVSMALVILVQFTLKEAIKRDILSGNTLATHINQIKRGLLIVSRSGMIMWLIGFTLVYSIANMFFSSVLNLPFLQETKRFNTNQLAIMGLIWNTMQTTSIFFASYLERSLGQSLSILAVVILTPLLFFGLSLSNNFIVSSVILGLYYGSMSFRDIIVDAYLNKHIDSQYRATVLSIASMILSSLAILILPVLGTIVDRSSLSTGILLLVIGTLILGSLSVIVKRSVDEGESRA
jgi:MFS family permease